MCPLFLAAGIQWAAALGAGGRHSSHVEESLHKGVAKTQDVARLLIGLVPHVVSLSRTAMCVLAVLSWAGRTLFFAPA